MTRYSARLITRPPGPELAALPTKAVLALHDRFIGRLDGPARARMLRAARANGWDRGWDDGPLAA